MCDCRYDYTLFFSFIVLVPCAFVLAVLSKIRHTMEVITKPRKTDDALEQRQRAFDLQVPPGGVLCCRCCHVATSTASTANDQRPLQVLGLAEHSQRRALKRYFEGWNVRADFAVFLSHFKMEAAAVRIQTLSCITRWSSWLVVASNDLRPKHADTSTNCRRPASSRTSWCVVWSAFSCCSIRVIVLNVSNTPQVRSLRVKEQQVFLDSDNLTDLRQLLVHIVRKSHPQTAPKLPYKSLPKYC